MDRICTRAKAGRIKVILDSVRSSCETPEEVSLLRSAVVKKADGEWPGTAKQRAAELNSNFDCCCRKLLPALGKLRETWLQDPRKLVQQLDMAVCSGGLSSAARMRKMGYNVSNKRVRQYHLKRPPRHQPLQGRNVGGRPSKVDNSLNVAAVRAVLDKNSVSASLTCVCRQRQPDGSVLRVRKQRRTLSGQLSTIYKSSPSIHRSLAETQFRCLVASEGLSQN